MRGAAELRFKLRFLDNSRKAETALEGAFEGADAVLVPAVP